MAEKFDLAIFGSSGSAALLAHELAQTHKLRVLLVTDQIQSIRLPAMPQTSTGFCTSALLYALISAGASRFRSLFSNMQDADIFTAGAVTLYASQASHFDLINFVEGAAIYLDLTCERRVGRVQNTEQLVFTDSFLVNERALQLHLQAQFQNGDAVVQITRDQLENSHITKEGKLSAHLNGQTVSALHLLYLDSDLILETMGGAIARTPLRAQAMQTFRFQPERLAQELASQDISKGLWQSQFEQNDILFSAPGKMDQLANHLFKFQSEIADRRILQRDQTLRVESIDGYPVFGQIPDQKIYCFAGAREFETMFMFELAGQMAAVLGDSRSALSSIWLDMGFSGSRPRGGTFMSTAEDVAHG